MQQFVPMIEDHLARMKAIETEMKPIPFLQSLPVAAILCVRLAIAAPGLPDLHAYRRRT